ncbi:hypothetical protein LO50_05150, partial [Stutzerimonas stutzeri]
HFQHSWIRQPRLGQLISLLFREERQPQTGHEKNARKYSSKPTQKGSRTLASENSCRSTRTERSTSICTLALLQQYQRNNT